MATAEASDLPEGGIEQVEAHVVSGPAVIGPDDHLESPGVVAPAELGVADEPAFGTLPGHEPGEARPSPVHQVQPLVLTQGPVSVGHRDLVEEFGDLGDVGLAHAPLDLDVVHGHAR